MEVMGEYSLHLFVGQEVEKRGIQARTRKRYFSSRTFLPTRSYLTIFPGFLKTYKIINLKRLIWCHSFGRLQPMAVWLHLLYNYECDVEHYGSTSWKRKETSQRERTDRLERRMEGRRKGKETKKGRMKRIGGGMEGTMARKYFSHGCFQWPTSSNYTLPPAFSHLIIISLCYESIRGLIHWLYQSLRIDYFWKCLIALPEECFINVLSVPWANIFDNVDKTSKPITFPLSDIGHIWFIEWMFCWLSLHFSMWTISTLFSIVYLQLAPWRENT